MFARPVKMDMHVWIALLREFSIVRHSVNVSITIMMVEISNAYNAMKPAWSVVTMNTALNVILKILGDYWLMVHVSALRAPMTLAIVVI